jgi:hypothetical protein
VADTDKLRPYTPAGYPTLGNDRRYIDNELKKISAALASVNSVLAALEARLVAGGL